MLVHIGISTVDLVRVVLCVQPFYPNPGIQCAVVSLRFVHASAHDVRQLVDDLMDTRFIVLLWVALLSAARDQENHPGTYVITYIKMRSIGTERTAKGIPALYPHPLPIPTIASATPSNSTIMRIDHTCM
jgi:hypothetical protein